jgi:high-affinity Fe2+/Pb2+ permease
MRKNKNIILITVVLAILALILVLRSSKSTIKANFAVEDVSAITKIFMSDKKNNSVTLKKIDEKNWLLNDKYPARSDGMEIILETISKLQVREPVSKSGRNNVIKWLAAKSVKVEIYEIVYRIDLFKKIRLFPHEKLTKVYYVGDETQDNLGTFMLIQGSDEPFIVSVPGFRGYVSPQYSALESEWRRRTIFETKIGELKSVRLDYPATPDASFEISRYEKNFSLKLLKTNSFVADFDTLKVIQYLNSFANLGIEAFLDKMDKHAVDTIISKTPIAILTVTDITGKSQKLKAFMKPADIGSVDDITNKPLTVDRDRFYGLINDDKDFALIQYFVFNSVLQPVSIFRKDVDKKTKE